MGSVGLVVLIVLWTNFGRWILHCSVEKLRYFILIAMRYKNKLFLYTLSQIHEIAHLGICLTLAIFVGFFVKWWLAIKEILLHLMISKPKRNIQCDWLITRCSASRRVWANNLQMIGINLKIYKWQPQDAKLNYKIRFGKIEKLNLPSTHHQGEI